MKKLITILMLAACFSLTGCYVQNVQQGNVISSAKVAKLQMNMSKQQVLNLLGEPVLVDVFNANLWSYVYTKQIHGGKIMRKDLILHFQDNKLAKIQKKLTATAATKKPTTKKPTIKKK